MERAATPRECQGLGGSESVFHSGKIGTGEPGGDRGSGEPVWAKLALPVPEYDVGERNGYRFTPWRTLNGEKASCPFD